MTTPEACRRPGCTGTIQDGYCDACGMAPVSAAPAAPAAPALAVPVVAAPGVVPGTTGPVVMPVPPGAGAPLAGPGANGSAPPPPPPPSGPRPSLSGPVPAAPLPGADASIVSSRPSWLVSGPTAGSGKGSVAPSPSTRTSGRTRGTRLGAGLVRIPPQAAIDPTSVVMTHPEVSEDKRFCSNCNEPVGRRRGDRPGRLDGFCGSCGRRFDFAPKLEVGDLVGGQYDVAGCLAHGGLGWIYLAQDRRVADRWVVLKGLLDTGDAEALRAAVKEKRFLAEVEHPNIVKIFNFVEHDGAGYIVMEYIGGPSLKALLKQRLQANGNRPDPLPVAMACAYVLGILPAFGYLHEHGYVYCDFKPDNLIQQGDDVKLIDLGGVRRIDDTDAVIYGTVGFQAPEIAEAGPSASSDLYTIGRTLAVLTMDFKGYQTTRQHTLPEPSEQTVLARYPAFHRFLLRATAADPAVRFATAEEMATQLTGVLRQVVALDGADLRPAPSTLFGTDRTVVVDDDDVTDVADVRVLPMLRVDPDDPATAFLSSMDASDPDALVAQIRSGLETHFVPDTSEVHFRLVRALIDGDHLDQAATELRTYDANGTDWRTRWYGGVIALSAGDPTGAFGRFVDVAHWLPGELAPQLALGLCAERLGRPAEAVPLYDTVRRTDASYVAATLGLARCHIAAGDVHAAMDAFRAVGKGTRAHTDAQLALARSLVRGHRGSPPAPAQLAEASSVLEQLALDPVRRSRAAIGLLTDVLALLDSGVAPQKSVTFLGRPLTEHGVREGLEQAYRTLARLADREERIALVDRANRVRPRTLV